MSHFGRPKDGPVDKYSLKHLVKHLHELLGGNTKASLPMTVLGEQAKLTSSMLKRSFVIGEPSLLQRRRKRGMQLLQKN